MRERPEGNLPEITKEMAIHLNEKIKYGWGMGELADYFRDHCDFESDTDKTLYLLQHIHNIVRSLDITPSYWNF
jgi:hypothetical protein